MEYSYTPNNTFAEVHQDTNQFMFIRGPVGSGKSSGCIWHCLLNALKQNPDSKGVRRSKYGIIRASYPALKSTVIASWKDWFQNLITIVYDTPIRGTIKIPHPDGVTTCDISLTFLALDREEDVNKLQSLELTGCHINEAAEIPQAVFQMVKSRIDRYPTPLMGGAIDPFIILDYNSVPTDHWLYTMAEEVHPHEHSFYHQPPALLMIQEGDSDIIDQGGNMYSMNPEADNLGHYVPGEKWDEPPTPKSVYSEDMRMWWIPHLSKNYYVNQCYGAEPDWVNVMILNNYGMVRAGKPVYPQYIDTVHYAEKLNEPIFGVPIIIGMDVGLTPAACFCQITPSGTLNVFDEIVTEDCSIREFCQDYLKPKLHNDYKKFNYYIVVDPAAINRSANDKKAAYDIIKDEGLPVILAPSNNDLKRRESVMYFLRKQEGLKVGVNCPMLRKGFISGYQFAKKRTALMNVRDTGKDMFNEKPEKSIYSHIHDGLQYAALELSEGRVARRAKKKMKSLRSNSTGVKYNQPADAVGGY